MRRKRVFKTRRPGILVRLMDESGFVQGAVRTSRTLRNMRTAYIWAQRQLAESKFKNPQVLIYRLVDTVKKNQGSFRAARVLD